MRALITGITGFAGRHLARHLLGLGYDVWGVSMADRAPIDLTMTGTEVRFVNCDLRNKPAVAETLASARPGEIYHLAGQSSVALSWAEPVLTFEINVIGTINLMDAACKYAPKAKLLIIGSGDEYGPAEEGEGPVTETSRLRPQSPYALSKVCADLLADQYYKVKKLNSIRVRPFNHIGPGQRPDFATSDFAKQIAGAELGKRKAALKVGNLSVRRDFTDVRDIVRAYGMALAYCIPGEVYNICSGRVYALSEVVEIYLGLAKVKMKVEPEEERLRHADVHVIIGDASKFKLTTGWKAEISLEKSLSDVLDYWRDILSRGRIQR